MLIEASVLPQIICRISRGNWGKTVPIGVSVEFDKLTAKFVWKLKECRKVKILPEEDESDSGVGDDIGDSKNWPDWKQE